MREALSPRLHLFVCANHRENSSLGPGCGARGEAVFDALKAANREVVRIWITKTHCLGICPKNGCTVARYPKVGPPILTEVTVADVPALLASPQEIPADPRLAAMEKELGAIEELQRKKVLDLARRLKPGLTLEDVQNPHDWPELDDPDWHYADGVLTGIASVKSALMAQLKKRDS